MVTAVGGHYTVSGAQVAPSPWSLSLGGRHRGKQEWVNQEGRSGTSGASAATVSKNWLEKLCLVRGLT